MKQRIKSSRIITPDKIVDGYIVFENGKIEYIGCDDNGFDGATIDVRDNIVTAGFIEMHIHGSNGSDFLNGGKEEIKAGIDFLYAHGVTTVCPTVTSAAFEDMKRALLTIEELMKSGDTKAYIAGAHLEGPYFSPEQCGGQNTDYLSPPKSEDYLPLLREHSDSIIRWSYAPELDDGSFAKALTEHGVIPSAAHSAALYDDMKRGMENGLNTVTHLYSCTSTVTRKGGFRRLGIIETAFLEDGLTVELIADGCHLPIDLIKMIIKINGADRIMLVSDAMPITGLDVTEGEITGISYIVEDGVCKLSDRSAFCGSIALPEQLFKTAQSAGATLPEISKMMSQTPARILGLKTKGALKVGYDADIVILDDNYNVSRVFGGQTKM